MAAHSHHLHDPNSTGFRLTGRHVLIAFLAFFGLIIGVNLLFVNLALGTFTGLTDRDSYRTGISWNRQLERAAEMRALGWQVTLDPTVTPAREPAARLLDLTVTVRDADGRPIPGLALRGEARHPIAERYDLPLSFEPIDGGYRTRATLPATGDWTIRLFAETPEGQRYRIDREVRAW